VSTATLGAGTVLLTRHDEASAATASTVNVAGYEVKNVTIPNGPGANDSVVGSASNDLFVWDDVTLETGARATANGASRYGWNRSNDTTHIEDWFGGAGNDVLAGDSSLSRTTSGASDGTDFV